MGPEEQFLLGVLISLAIFCVVVAFWPPFWAKRRRNRQLNLPPPSSACRRNSTESVP